MRGRVAIIALGELLYSAQRKSVTSAQALANPFDKNITLDPDFLAIPGMADTITDQHFVERDRMGRTLAFMARLATDGVPGIKAIAIDRETAVLVEADGNTTVVANTDHETPYVYLLTGGDPTIVQPKTPLTFTRVQVRKVVAGESFDFADWSDAGSIAYVVAPVRSFRPSTPITRPPSTMRRVARVFQTNSTAPVASAAR